MAEPAADRQRRYRRHKQNDHSLCVPGRCDDVTPVVTRNGASDMGERGVKLEEAGRSLWGDVMAAVKLGPLQKVLLLEACRIADRLDRLDAQLRGAGEWLRLEADEGGPVVVVVDRALSEARQQATALKTIVAELRQSGRAVKPSIAGESKGGVGIVDLAERIAARRTSSAG